MKYNATMIKHDVDVDLLTWKILYYITHDIFF
jgi:hypothetical protein